MKLGIVGSRRYKNKDKVRKAIEAVINEYGDKIVIISGGAYGADLFGKEIALEKGLKYIEFNPSHTNYNQYSGMNEDWYNKPYNVGNFFERNTFIAEHSDYIIAFIPDGMTSNGTMDTVNKARKLNKRIIILN